MFPCAKPEPLTLWSIDRIAVEFDFSVNDVAWEMRWGRLPCVKIFGRRYADPMDCVELWPNRLKVKL